MTQADRDNLELLRVYNREHGGGQVVFSPVLLFLKVAALSPGTPRFEHLVRRLLSGIIESCLPVPSVCLWGDCYAEIMSIE